jgi:hypothetical protein
LKLTLLPLNQTVLMISKFQRLASVASLVGVFVTSRVSWSESFWVSCVQFMLGGFKMQLFCMSYGQRAFVSVGLLCFVYSDLWVSCKSFDKHWMVNDEMSCVSVWLLVWVMIRGDLNLLCIMYAVTFALFIHWLK